MLKEKTLDWDLVHKVMDGTATPADMARWEKLSRQQAGYAALIPWLRSVNTAQQDVHSPFYAVDAWADFKTTLPRKNIFRLWQRAAMAAAVALIIGAGWWFYQTASQPAVHTFVTYNVPNGQRKLVTLPDNTRIWINAGSSLQLPENESDTTREVWLEGEGFFDVAENPSRPFIVHTPATTVRVLGTSFNIEAYGQMPVAVTVASGKVRFSGAGGQSVTLTQNQRAVWMAGTGTFETMDTDAAIYNTWREGVLQFNDEPLADVLATLERRYNVPVKVIGAIGAGQYCTARFAPNESLDNILESLRHIYGLKISKQDSVIIIQSKQP